MFNFQSHTVGAVQPKRSSSRSLPAVVLAGVTFALSAFTSASTAHAQIEGRCPAGWSVSEVMVRPPQKLIAGCDHEGLRMLAVEMQSPVPPGSPEEAQVGMQLHVVDNGGPVTFVDETVGGRPARTSRFVDAQQLIGGTENRVAIMLAMIPVPGRNTTVVLQGVAKEDRKAEMESGLQAIVAGMIGLDGSVGSFHATVVCPTGTVDRTEPDGSVNGVHLASQCANPNSGSLITLESRLQVTNIDEAMASARIVEGVLRRQMGRPGVLFQTDPVRLESFGPVTGYMTAVHVDLTAAMPPGSPPDEAHIDAPVVILPMTTGHVILLAVTPVRDPVAALEAARKFVAESLRIDGAPVKVTSMADAGVIVTAVSPVAPPVNSGSSSTSNVQPPVEARPRPRAIDPNAPIFVPEDEAPLKSEPPKKSKRGCGCDVPAGSHTSTVWASLSLLGLLAAGRRRRSAP